MSMTMRTMAASAGSSSTSSTNERSIFSAETGKRVRYARLE